MPTKKCPVCAWEIEDGGKTVEIDGKTVIVCSDECAAKLRASKRAGVKPSKPRN